MIKVGKLSILQVISDPKVPKVRCSLIDQSGKEKDIMTIFLQDNGIHVHKTLDNDHYIIPPVPQIGVLIKEVIEEVAEELNAEAIVFRYGENEPEEVDDLVLSDAWYDIERLALAASKHAALSEEMDSKVIVDHKVLLFHLRCYGHQEGGHFPLISDIYGYFIRSTFGEDIQRTGTIS
ncbi:hypothetical protein [Metallosphaera hakonensis]|uniref:hypothetical protein n=1 Tax=Metallosphaera hakonensis TaxID=79601 RepID=UPI000ACABFE0|nr:hypothetical protein [Metallosphaera hakonensis]